ncbi:hypothetical protein Cob_v012403 [Colletotrichum orbiculare MAFF 240422]|uniref:Rhodopsin domain-containing protein n=1 Tax=Colletotrichum orbiculare (strain 104-T / ATCC 96160 / CBS 514.97 / LARS 414 / MAFF 240422) TaxID=1213857 RepID=A0A484F959_COLOR|nr:hypothetical protein Cob_v012403 [Colletotrichum orbiculare MAFF 240422]
MTAGQVDGILKRDRGYEREIRLWVIAGCIIICMRFIVRIRLFGLRGLNGDDYTMILTCFIWVGSFIVLDLIYRCGTNLDLTADQIRILSDEEVLRLVRGSKFQLMAWYLYSAQLWSMKASVLLFYKRLTFGLWRHARFLTYLTWLTILSYLAIVSTITFGCLPYHHNWGVRPLPSDRCLFKIQNLLVTTSFNIITDMAILSLPIPALKTMRLPAYKKMFREKKQDYDELKSKVRL